jgi:hypothetical protein
MEFRLAALDEDEGWLKVPEMFDQQEQLWIR